MLRKLREARDEEGFTLIELLVVVIIIGILAAIAIPVFLNQREKAYVRSAESDVRNAAVAFESYFSDTNDYPATSTAAITNADSPYDLGNGDEVVVSDSVSLEWESGGTDYVTGAFCIVATHSQLGAGPHATYKSDAGGVQETAGAC